jgi:heat shock protein HslJ
MKRIFALAALAVLTAAACVPEAPSAPGQDAAAEMYKALGQEPGWALTIANGQIDYTGNYGEKHILVPRPDPRTTFNGHRYETARLTVDVTHGRCNDAMSGHGYADQVLVIAEGETYRGCGGTRRPDWDM